MHLTMFVWIIIVSLLKTAHDAALILSLLHLIVCFFAHTNPSQRLAVTQRLEAVLACFVRWTLDCGAALNLDR